MHRVTTDELGRYGGRPYFLTVAVEPDPTRFHHFDPYRDAEEWCATVHFPATVPSGSDTQVARIDTSHGRPHFDELYLPNQPKTWLQPEFTLADAERLLVSNWRRYASAYVRFHADE